MARRSDPPRMLDETPAQLVAHLADPNGWWRDTAQQLLVLAQDRSVIPALSEMARGSDNQLARIHALWTLEGLDALEPAFVRGLMADADPQVRRQAIRASETLYKGGDRSFAADYRRMTTDADVDVAIQAMLTANTLEVAGARAAIEAAQAANDTQGVQLVAKTLLDAGVELGRGGGLEMTEAYPPEAVALIEKGRTAYAEVCFACHGTNGRGEPVPGSPEGTRAPALAASPRVLGHRDYVISALLHGLTGPVDGTTYTEVMIPMGEQTDEWIAGVASYIRNAFGNRASVVTPADVARVRAATSGRSAAFDVSALVASLPRQVVVTADWRVTASHNTATARNALTIQPWTSGRKQAAGMWLQVELPAEVSLTEIQFESSPAVESDEPAVAGAPTRSVFGSTGETPAIGYPRAYEVRVSIDGATWSEPVATGQGSGKETVIAFAPVRAKFVRLVQTGADAGAPPLSIQRLRLFEVD